MGEYANLNIWRKVTPTENDLFYNLYLIQQNGSSIEDYLTSIGKDAMQFPLIDFKKVNNQLYYHLTPMDFREQPKHLLQCKYNIEKEWLLPFSYQEMKIDSCLFTAETTIQQAISRMKKVAMKGRSNFLTEFDEFFGWLQRYGNDDDLLEIHSGLIYVDFSGETSDEEIEKYIKNTINEKVRQIKQFAMVPHWTCTANN